MSVRRPLKGVVADRRVVVNAPSGVTIRAHMTYSRGFWWRLRLLKLLLRFTHAVTGVPVVLTADTKAGAP